MHPVAYMYLYKYKHTNTHTHIHTYTHVGTHVSTHMHTKSIKSVEKILEHLNIIINLLNIKEFIQHRKQILI